MIVAVVLVKLRSASFPEVDVELRRSSVPEVSAASFITKDEAVVAPVAFDELKVWAPVPDVKLRAVVVVLFPIVIVLALPPLPKFKLLVVPESIVSAPAAVIAAAEKEIVSTEATPVNAPAVVTFNRRSK